MPEMRPVHRQGHMSLSKIASLLVVLIWTHKSFLTAEQVCRFLNALSAERGAEAQVVLVRGGYEVFYRIEEEMPVPAIE